MDRRDYATQKYENQVPISDQVLIHELSRVSQSHDPGEDVWILLVLVKNPIEFDNPKMHGTLKSTT